MKGSEINSVVVQYSIHYIPIRIQYFDNIGSGSRSRWANNIPVLIQLDPGPGEPILYGSNWNSGSTTPEMNGCGWAEGLLVVLDSIEKHCQQRISDRVPQPPAYLLSNGTDKQISALIIFFVRNDIQLNPESKYILAGSKNLRGSMMI